MKPRFVGMLLGSAAFIATACNSGVASPPSSGPASSSSSGPNFFACGLRGKVALVGFGEDQAVLLTPGDGQTLERSTLPIGKGAIIAKSSEDGRRLFVVSRGQEGVEGPSLTVVDLKNSLAITSRRYDLPALHSGMVIDPEGRWVALYTVLTRDYTGIDVERESPPIVTGVEGETRNEVVVVDVDAPPSQAITSHVFDAPEVVPQRITFSPTLHLPGATGRLLAVETESQVSILDLEHVTASPPSAPILVATLESDKPVATPPASPVEPLPVPPVELLYDDGEATKNDDARLVVRLGGESKVSVLTFAPTSSTSAEPTDGRGFEIVRSEFVADATIGQFEIVGTADGPRLALLLPSASAIELVDLTTRSKTGSVSLPHPYQSWAKLHRQGSSDTFVLTNAVWSIADNSAAGLWSLDATEGAPYGQVETVRSLMQVGFELQMPSSNDDLALFRAGFYQGDPAYFIFDLRTHAVTRVEASSPGDPMISGDGRHFWFFAAPLNPDGTSTWSVETVNLEGLGAAAAPAILAIEGTGPGALFDLERAGGGRVMVEVAGGVGTHWDAPIHGHDIVTVFDGETPDTSPSMTYRNVLHP